MQFAVPLPGGRPQHDLRLQQAPLAAGTAHAAAMILATTSSAFSIGDLAKLTCPLEGFRWPARFDREGLVMPRAAIDFRAAVPDYDDRARIGHNAPAVHARACRCGAHDAHDPGRGRGRN